MKKIIILISFFFSTQIDAQIKYDDGGINAGGGGISEFSIQGNSWNNRFITYFFQNTTPDINAAAARNSIRAAFDSWQGVTENISLKYVMQTQLTL